MKLKQKINVDAWGQVPASSSNVQPWHRCLWGDLESGSAIWVSSLKHFTFLYDKSWRNPPRGASELSPRDSIPSSEQDRPGLMKAGGNWGGWGREVGTSRRIYEDQREKESERQAGNGGRVAEGRNNGAKERKLECGFCEKKKKKKKKKKRWGKTAKEIQSSLTFPVQGPLPKAVQGSGSGAAKEHGNPNTLSKRIFFFRWIIPACLQDTTHPSELAFQASHLKWCIGNVTSP